MNRIASLRKSKGMSQIALSMKLNISQKMVSAYENGKSEPSIATLKRLADIFQTSVDSIIGYTDVKQPIDKITQQNLNEIECSIEIIFLLITMLGGAILRIYLLLIKYNKECKASLNAA